MADLGADGDPGNRRVTSKESVCNCLSQGQYVRLSRYVTR